MKEKPGQAKKVLSWLIFNLKETKKMKYIQSFYQYPVTFSSIAKTIPARSAKGELRNIAEVTEKDLERLQNSEPFFRELVSKKKVRVLNHLPENYRSSAQRINEANDEIARLKAENEKLKAESQAKAETKEEEKTEQKEAAETKEEVTAEESKAKKSNSKKK